MDAKQLRDVLDFAVDAATAAGTYTLEYFRPGAPYELKPDDSPVTIADRGAEERLRKRIESAFPTHGILGEEFGEKPAADPQREPARWILDPIDGTISFISGVPLYSVLVGLEWAGEMVAGVIHLPALHETICAARGLGCRWNGRPARVSDVSDFSIRATERRVRRRPRLV
jgi:fructose-1,6-bisphosphatase/inositol monophosphatase family enzyme